MSVPSNVKQRTATILLGDDTKREIEVYESPVPGLVVHRLYVYKAGTQDHRPTNKWQITHEATGRALLTPYEAPSDMKHAFRMAGALNGVTDWTSDILSLSEDAQRSIKEQTVKCLQNIPEEDDAIDPFASMTPGEWVIEPVRKEGDRWFAVKNTKTEEVADTLQHRGEATALMEKLNAEAQ